MAPTNKFQLVVEAQARGDAELQRLSATVNKLTEELARANKKIGDDAIKNQVRYSDALKKMRQDTESSIGGASKASTEGALSIGRFATAALGAYAALKGASAGFDTFIRGASEAAFEIKGLSVSTGLSIAATDKLRAVAKLSGFDIRNLQEAALDLSQALKDTSGQGETSRNLLRQLGVSAFDATGKTRGLGEVFTDVLDSLSKVNDITDRVNLSRVLGGEDAAKKSQILISQYAELNRLASDLGFGTRDGLLKSLEDSNKQLRAFDLQWEIIKGKLAEKISPIVIPLLLKVGKLASGDISALGGAAFQPAAQAAQDEVIAKMFPSIGGEFLGRFAPTIPANIGDGGLAAGGRLSAAFRTGQSGSESGMKLRLDQIGKDRALMVTQLSSGSLNESTFKTVSAGLARLDAEQRSINKQLAFIEKARASGEITVDSSSLIDVNIGAGISTRRVPSLRGRASSLADLPEFISTQADRAAVNQFNDDGLGARAAGEFQAEQRARQRNIQFIGQELTFQERKIELLTGPGGELAAINKIAALRRSALDQELQSGAEIFDLNERRLQIEEDRTLRILDLQRQRTEEARGLASGFVGSVQSGRPGDFFRGEGGRLINQIGTNALTGTFQRVQSTLGSFGGSLGLGGLLKGTLLDPANATPLDKTAAATERAADSLERIEGRATGGLSVPGAGVSLPGGFDPIRALGPVSGFTGASRVLGQIGAGFSSVLVPGGLFAGLNGGSIQQGNGQATTQAGLGIDSTGARVANVTGSIATIGIGAKTAYDGFKRGGASGILQGTAAALGTAALIPGPQQPFIAAAAATAALVGMLLPDPKKARDMAIDRNIANAFYSEAQPMAFNIDQLGRGYDTNKRGDMRPITIEINALDSRSIIDHRESIADAVRQAVWEGHGINRAMQEAVLAA